MWINREKKIFKKKKSNIIVSTKQSLVKSLLTFFNVLCSFLVTD